MPVARHRAISSVERFFQFSLLVLVGTMFLGKIVAKGFIPSQDTGQISATTGAFSLVSVKSGFTARARRMNNSTAAYCESRATSESCAGSTAGSTRGA